MINTLIEGGACRIPTLQNGQLSYMGNKVTHAQHCPKKDEEAQFWTPS